MEQYPEAIGKADDGLGPYTPILAITDSPGELIPGKFCQGKGRAFYSMGGREHEAKKWKLVKGVLLPSGQ